MSVKNIEMRINSKANSLCRLRAFMKFEVRRVFDSPEPNVKWDVSDNNWPGVRVVKHGDEDIKSDSSRSVCVCEINIL